MRFFAFGHSLLVSSKSPFYWTSNLILQTRARRFFVEHLRKNSLEEPPMKRFPFIALALCLFAAASVSFEQTVNSRVSGTVKDTADAVVPGVKVTLTDTKTRETKTATTNEEGVFNIVDVRAGTYIVLAERASFKKKQVTDVEVHIDVPGVLNLVLGP